MSRKVKSPDGVTQKNQVKMLLVNSKDGLTAEQVCTVVGIRNGNFAILARQLGAKPCGLSPLGKRGRYVYRYGLPQSQHGK